MELVADVLGFAAVRTVIVARTVVARFGAAAVRRGVVRARAVDLTAGLADDVLRFEAAGLAEVLRRLLAAVEEVRFAVALFTVREAGRRAVVLVVVVRRRAVELAALRAGAFAAGRRFDEAAEAGLRAFVAPAVGRRLVEAAATRLRGAAVAVRRLVVADVVDLRAGVRFAVEVEVVDLRRVVAAFALVRGRDVPVLRFDAVPLALPLLRRRAEPEDLEDEEPEGFRAAAAASATTPAAAAPASLRAAEPMDAEVDFLRDGPLGFAAEVGRLRVLEALRPDADVLERPEEAPAFEPPDADRVDEDLLLLRDGDAERVAFALFEEEALEAVSRFTNLKNRLTSPVASLS